LKFLTSGKVKDIYDVGDGTILFKFSDRVSAYDVKFKQDIPQKGEVLCKFAEFWFNKLSVSNHFVRRESDTEIVVKKMQMLPIECVVRGYFYGSLVNRWKGGEFTVPEGTDTTLAAINDGLAMLPPLSARINNPVESKICTLLAPPVLSPTIMKLVELTAIPSVEINAVPLPNSSPSKLRIKSNDPAYAKDIDPRRATAKMLKITLRE